MAQGPLVPARVARERDRGRGFTSTVAIHSASFLDLSSWHGSWLPQDQRPRDRGAGRMPRSPKSYSLTPAFFS